MSDLLIPTRTMHGAMDQHAENIAVLFAEWIVRQQRCYGLRFDDGAVGWFYGISAGDAGFMHKDIGDTTDLYRLFLRSITR